MRALNDNEAGVLGVILTNGPMRIAEVAAALQRLLIGRDGQPPPSLARCNSWVRNSLRRLVALGIVEQVGPGLYMRGDRFDLWQAEQEHDEAAARLHALDVELAGLRSRLRTLTGRGGARDHAARRCAATWRAVVDARKAARR